MLILTLGVPRSGTVLVFNIVREILERRGVPFRAFNTNYPETERFLSAFDFKDNVVLHAHNMLPAVQKALQDERTTAFFNHRDPRDVLVSMMQLHDATFEDSLRRVEISFRHLEIARHYAKILFVPYEYLVTETVPWVGRIASKLAMPVTVAEAAAIGAATSLERHREIMQAVVEGSIPVQHRRNPNRELRESSQYFINDRHIQSGRPDRWREELDAARQAEAGRRLRRWLVALGYETDH